LAISELATNKRVEGGGEYFIISRSFGLNIGATIGIALYLSQAISVAFYVIAFTESFEQLFNIAKYNWGLDLPRQVVSLPAMAILAALMLTKGANMGVKTLYVIVGVLAVSLRCFSLGQLIMPRARLLVCSRLSSVIWTISSSSLPSFSRLLRG